MLIFIPHSETDNYNNIIWMNVSWLMALIQHVEGEALQIFFLLLLLCKLSRHVATQDKTNHVLIGTQSCLHKKV